MVMAIAGGFRPHYDSDVWEFSHATSWKPFDLFFRLHEILLSQVPSHMVDVECGFGT